MFWQARPMQLSAANLLIASQQIARGVQPPQREVKAQFAGALAKEGSASFEPMDFKTIGPEAPAAAVATARATSYGKSCPLGANIDIRV